jgi:beta-N-acetylhexosaminidase
VSVQRVDPQLDARSAERLIGAVLVPQLRVGEALPSGDWLARHPPLWCIAFGRARDGSTQAGLAELVRAWRAQCAARGAPRPRVCADLEEGAGLHAPEATRLPPALALAAADAGRAARGAPAAEPDWIERAGWWCGREARALGVELVLGPVLDVNTRADNPIIATRSFGDEVGAVARRGRRYALGLRRGGAAACAKHFPGHGDSALDSHAHLPRIEGGRELFEQRELVPFAGLLRGPEACEAVMAAHLDAPALTGEPGLSTSCSPRVLQQLLRVALEFRGAVLSDALDMGALATAGARGRELRSSALAALAAGCDGLLCPADPERAAHELVQALASGALAPSRLLRAARRMRALHAHWAPSPHSRAATWSRAARARQGELPADADAELGSRAAREFAQAAARAALCLEGGAWPLPPLRADPLAAALAPLADARSAWSAVALAPSAASAESLVVAAARVGAGRGRAGLEPEHERELLAHVLAGEQRAARGLRALVWMAAPRALPAELARAAARGELAVLHAFAPSPPMLAAVLDYLARPAACAGRMPLRAPAQPSAAALQ